MVSIGNQLFHVAQSGSFIFYINESDVFERQIEAMKGDVDKLKSLSTYAFKVEKSPSEFTSEMMLIKSERRVLEDIKYEFSAETPLVGITDH
tara:strand:+ start:400 stop:675 length:276 start_codon:yes stop_codon:yes gene_type:complete